MKLGWSHTFISQMFDHPAHGNGYYGIFNQDASATSTISPKASANYIRTMTTIPHDSTSDFAPTALAYSIPNEPATVHDLLLQKSDGTYELAVWADQVTGFNNMTVNLGARFTKVNVYDVVRGNRPVSVFHNVSAILLSLSDHAKVTFFGGAGLEIRHEFQFDDRSFDAPCAEVAAASSVDSDSPSE